MLCSSCTFYSEYNEQPKVNIPLNPSATIGKLRDNSLIAYIGGLALGGRGILPAQNHNVVY